MKMETAMSEDNLNISNTPDENLPSSDNAADSQSPAADTAVNTEAAAQDSAAEAATENTAAAAENAEGNAAADAENAEQSPAAATESATETAPGVNTEPAPKASKKTTVLLIVIIAVLVVIIAICGIVAFVKVREVIKEKQAASEDVIIYDYPGAPVPTDTDSAGTQGSVDDFPDVMEPRTYNVTTILGEYKGISVDYPDTTVDAADIESEIDYFLSGLEEAVEVTDRPIQEGDSVDIDYAGYRDGVAFEGGTGNNPELVIGSGQFIPGFEEGLIGVSVGETVSLDLTFPENYGNADLAGAAVVFEVTVNSITEYVIPELTDELVAENTDCSTIEEYKAYIADGLLEQNIEEADDMVKSLALRQVVDNASFTGEIAEEIADYAVEYKSYYDSLCGSYFGIDAVTYFGYMGYTEDDFYQMINEEAEYTIKYQHVLDEIRAVENLELSDEDYEEQFQNIFIDYYGYESKEEALENMTQEEIDQIVYNAGLRNMAESVIIDNMIVVK